MTIWYNAPAKDKKFANLAITDWGKANSKISFKEVAVKQDDDWVYLLGFAAGVDNAINTKDRQWKFEPQLVQIKFAKKDYEKTDWQTKEKKKVEQSRVEKAFCKLLSGLAESETIYTGAIIVQDSTILDYLISEVDSNGKAISPETLDMMTTNFLALLPLETSAELKLEDIAAHLEASGKSASGSGRFGGGGQPELARLQDREKFVVSQFKLAGFEVETIADIIKSYVDEPSPKAIACWEMLMTFVGKI